MNGDSLDIALILGCIGLSLFLFGLMIRIGKFKSWWLGVSNPIIPELAVYMMIPIGISFWATSALIIFPNVETRGDIFLFCIMPMLALSVILAFWRPRWIVPKWLLWLEDNHKDIYHLLRREAKKMGTREWGKQVSTQEDLEEWVAEVRRKRGV